MSNIREEKNAPGGLHQVWPILAISGELSVAKCGKAYGPRGTLLGPCCITRVGAMWEIWGKRGGHVGGEVEAYMESIRAEVDTLPGNLRTNSV